jgi:hypothetical protein
MNLSISRTPDLHLAAMPAATLHPRFAEAPPLEALAAAQQADAVGGLRPVVALC